MFPVHGNAVSVKKSYKVLKYGTGVVPVRYRYAVGTLLVRNLYPPGTVEVCLLYLLTHRTAVRQYGARGPAFSLRRRCDDTTVRRNDRGPVIDRRH